MNDTRTFRACPSAYIVFASIGFVLFVLGVFVGVKRADWSVAVIGLLFPIPFFVWLRAFGLVLGPDMVSYRSLFCREKSMRHGDIICVEPAAQASRRKGLITINVRSTTGDELRINAKVFSREAVGLLLRLKEDNNNKTLEN